MIKPATAAVLSFETMRISGIRLRPAARSSSPLREGKLWAGRRQTSRVSGSGGGRGFAVGSVHNLARGSTIWASFKADPHASHLHEENTLTSGKHFKRRPGDGLPADCNDLCEEAVAVVHDFENAVRQLIPPRPVIHSGSSSGTATTRQKWIASTWRVRDSVVSANQPVSDVEGCFAKVVAPPLLYGTRKPPASLRSTRLPERSPHTTPIAKMAMGIPRQR